jgi:hypothetical protein
MARVTDRIEGDHAARGITIAFEDLLIAATALQLGFGVVRGNVRHFPNVQGNSTRGQYLIIVNTTNPHYLANGDLCLTREISPHVENRPLAAAGGRVSYDGSRKRIFWTGTTGSA